MTEAITSLMTVVSTVVSTIEDNSVMMVYFCAGLVGVAVSVVRKLIGRY